jgi:hypothetical protein
VSHQRREAIAAIVLGTLAAVAVYTAIVTLDPRFMDPRFGNDVWFEGDLPRIVNDVTHRWAPHSRAGVHPLFSLFACAGVYAMRAMGMPTLRAVAALAAGGAAVWTMLLFLVLRAVTPTRTEAILFTAIGATTAAAVFWLAVPETYVFGSATILAALWIAAVSERRPLREGWFVAASAATLAITVTNWTAGIAATATRWPCRRSLQITVNAFAVVVVLWAAQRIVIPHADFFIGYSNEQRYLLRPETGGPRRILAVMFAHSIVMPPVQTREKPGRGTVLSVQLAGLGAGDWGRHVGLLAWLALFAIGLRGWLPSLRTSGWAQALAAVVVAEVTLHLLYGTETFLYSLNVMPALIVIAAHGTRTRARPLVAPLAAVLLVCGGMTNLRMYLESRRYFMPAHQAQQVTTEPRSRFRVTAWSSLISQRDDRIELGRLPRRPEARGHGDDDHHERDRRNRQRIAGARLHQQALQ